MMRGRAQSAFDMFHPGWPFRLLCGERAHTGLSLRCGQASGCANGIGRARSFDKVGKKQTWGRYLSHTHYKLLNLSVLEVSLVNKMFHL